MDDRIADRWYDAVSVAAPRPRASSTARPSAAPATESPSRATARLEPRVADEPRRPGGSRPSAVAAPAPTPAAVTGGPGTAVDGLRGLDLREPFVPADPGDLGAAGMRAELRELTGQLLGALAAEPVDRAAGLAVGARLARIGFVDPDDLARTVEVLGPSLSAAAGPGRAPAAFAVLGAVASGHGEALRSRALGVAGDRHHAELAGLRRAERARRRSDRLFRAVFEHAGIGTLVIDESGAILEANDTARAITGRDLTRLSIGDVWDLVRSRDRGELIDMWAAVRAGRPGRGVWRLDRPAGPDNGQVWVSLTAAMVDDETVVGGSYYAVTIEDVTSRQDPRTGIGGGTEAAGQHGSSGAAGGVQGPGAGQPAAGQADRRVLEQPAADVAAAVATKVTRSIAAGLRSGQFVVHYQPIVRLADGTIEGAEALVRWDHPRRGLLFPEEFIGVAEESGLIVPLGLHVLETACRDAARWAQTVAAVRPAVSAAAGAASPAETGPGATDAARARASDAAVAGPFVSVNLSVRQLEEPDAAATILDVVRRAGLDPRRLQLELVESLMIDAFGRQPEALRQLADAGVRIAIDDFGTGYSNFAYLPTLPVRALKLAGQFCARDEEAADGDGPVDAAGPVAAAAAEGAAIAVAVAAVGGSDAAVGGSDGAGLAVAEPAEAQVMDQLVEGIVAIAHRLGHTVTAESVETQAQAARMLALGADLGQGHLFGRPMCADKMTAALAMATAAVPGGPASASGPHGLPDGPLVPPARDGRCRHATPHPHP